MPFRSTALFLVVLLAALSTEPAPAQTGKTSATKTTPSALPIAPDRPGRWREAIYDDDPRRYRCLRGPASTPHCALANRMTCETQLYRVGRGDGMQFCRNAYVHLPAHVTPEHVEVFGGSQYHIEKVRVATDDDIEAARRTDDWKMLTPETEPRVGDILVSVFRRLCPGGPPCHDPRDHGELTNYHPVLEKDRPYETRSTFCLRQDGARWRLVWWPGERPKDVDEDDPTRP